MYCLSVFTILFYAQPLHPNKNMPGGLNTENSTTQTTRNIVKTRQVRNHGLLAFSRDPLATAQLITIMEEAAELTLDARSLGGEKPFPADALARERKHMQQSGAQQM